MSETAILPRTMPALVRLIWSQVLFPGTPNVSTRCRWPSLFILLVLPAVLLYPSLNFHLFEPDEGRYAEIPREMLVRGDWVVPYLQGLPYLDKPPLVYWLVMLSYQVCGVATWSARLVPALAVHACILLTYLLGRRSLGERAAFWGALILGLAPGFLSVGRLLVLDGLLTLWTTLALFSAFEAVRSGHFLWRWWLLAALACGLGVLTKGPVAVVLLAGPLAAYLWLNRLRGVLTVRAVAVFLGVVLAVTLPWYAALSLRIPEFPRYFFWEHNVVRFVQPFDHQRPIWFYGPILLGGLLPGSLLIVAFLRFLLGDRASDLERRCPELGFQLLAGGWCVLFFSLSGCKLPTYILPAFPPVALALGYYVAGSRWAHSRWTAATAALAVVLLAGLHHIAIPIYARHHSPLRNADQVVRYCGAADTPVVCYPRGYDSVAFYLGRDDLRGYRSKETPELVTFMQKQRRTVVLFTHRNSLETLRRVLPPELHMTDETPLCGSARLGPEGSCYMAVVRRKKG